MRRPPKKHRNRGRIDMLVLWFAMATLFSCAADAQECALPSFLKDVPQLSKKEWATLEKCGVLVKEIASKVKHEIVVVSIARVNAPKAVFVDAYLRKNIVEPVDVITWGTLSVPPTAAEFGKIDFAESDFGILKKCIVGKCKVKLPRADIEQYNLIASSSPDYAARANAVMRQSLQAYLQRYQQGGSAALITYADKKQSVNVADALKGLLEQSPYIRANRPELASYWLAYPKADLPKSETVFFWSTVLFGGKAKRPIINVFHRVSYQPENAKEFVQATVRLYASHYYESSLDVTTVTKDPADADRSYYININRMRIDVLRSAPGFLTGGLHRDAQKVAQKRAERIKATVESLARKK